VKMARRKGLGKGRGKGYKNLIPIKDSRVHSQSSRGIKQPQRIKVINIQNIAIEEQMANILDRIERNKDIINLDSKGIQIFTDDDLKIFAKYKADRKNDADYEIELKKLRKQKETAYKLRKENEYLIKKLHQLNAEIIKIDTISG